LIILLTTESNGLPKHVHVLEGKPGDECILLGVTVNYHYVKNFTVPDVLPLLDIGHILQNVGRCSIYLCICRVQW